ncbi:TonB family protein [Pseudomonas sp. BN414]|uniref:energy transducer TonB n=1 Tax=Pseudomonas sp. BN414 TaxID=2567888 RepID=UPI002454B7BE|nr:TonB family protein [Pseudomonas sp. BN414]
MSLQLSPPMMVMLVSPEPEPAPVTASAPAMQPALPTRPTQPVKVERPVLKPVVASKPRPAPAKPVVPAESTKAKANTPTEAQAVAASAAPSRPAQAAAASAPAAASKPVVTEVFSREPSFLTPPKPPIYPAQAKRRNQQGLVLVEVRLDDKGLLREIRLLRSSGVESLDRSAMDAVAAWRFRPETQNGQPVPSRVHIPIEFALSASR